MAQFTAADLQTALRTEANTVKNMGGTNIRFTLTFTNGLSKTYKLNPDGTWKKKPTATEQGMVRFEWIDTSQNRIVSDDGTTVTYADTAYTETIDPASVIDYEFIYDIETTSQRDIPSDNE